ncbi:MAG: S26 family signal peptidase [Acidobacteria bacterium]|nr:S26 family signal peptidase [Acidobacteriota bacterium]
MNTDPMENDGLPTSVIEAIRLMLRAGRPVTVRIAGTSMAPLIREGDRAVVVPLEGRAPRRGDPVLFFSGAILVVHRALRVRRRAGEWVVLQKGDAVSTGGWVPLSRVLGRVAAVLRPDGSCLDLERRASRWRARVAALADRAWLRLTRRPDGRLRAGLGRVPGPVRHKVQRGVGWGLRTLYGHPPRPKR